MLSLTIRANLISVSKSNNAFDFINTITWLKPALGQPWLPYLTN